MRSNIVSLPNKQVLDFLISLSHILQHSLSVVTHPSHREIASQSFRQRDILMRKLRGVGANLSPDV